MGHRFGLAAPPLAVAILTLGTTGLAQEAATQEEVIQDTAAQEDTGIPAEEQTPDGVWTIGSRTLSAITKSRTAGA